MLELSESLNICTFTNTMSKIQHQLAHFNINNQELKIITLVCCNFPLHIQ